MNTVSVLLPLLGVITQQCVAFTVPTATNLMRTSREIQNPNLLPTQLSLFGFSSVSEVIELEEEEETMVFDSTAESITNICVLGLRLGTCSLMMHHGLDKIQNVDGFSANVVAKFFGFLPGDPSFWTLSAAATQIVGAVLLAIGFLSRPVALSMMATMVVAVIFHLLNTGLEGFPLAVVTQHSYNYELAAMYVGVLAYFSAAGAGAYSADELVLGGELKLYESAFNKVFNKDYDEEIA